MAEVPGTDTAFSEYLAQHLVRYEELIPCTTAFIDTRTPGSQEKENFTIIGPGVAENPNQHVHIMRPHGFNIGGARQPPGCVNSQHSHETAEVFVVLSGEWVFTTGEDGNDGQTVLHPGDTISIPTRCFRGFENVGDSTGFLFAVLGGDDPGRVTWAPYVFDMAKEYGLVLMENGQLVDTAAGEEVPEGEPTMPPTSAQDVAALSRLDSQALEKCVVRHADLHSRPAVYGGHEAGVIGEGPLNWPHDFQLTRLLLEPGENVHEYRCDVEEVLLIYSGELTVTVQGHSLTLVPGDVFTSELGEARKLDNQGSADCEVFIVRGGEDPKLTLV